MASEGRKGDRRHTDHEIDLDHPPIYDDEDKDRNDIEQKLYDKALQEDPKQRTAIHCLQRSLHRGKRRRINSRAALNDTARLTDHITCHVKYGKRDIERIADQRHRDKCLKHPLEKDPGFKVREIVVRDDELDQLVAGDERQDQSSDRHDDILGDVSDHRKYTGFKAGRRLCKLIRHFPNLAV